MNYKSLNLLEFPKVLERLAALAAFSAGKQRALELEPLPTHAAVVRAHQETAELLHLLEGNLNVGLAGAHDVRPQAEAAKRGGLLTAAHLLEIRDTLECSRTLHRSVERAASVAPLLWDRIEMLPDTTEVARAISRCIGTRAEVLDAASPNLARLRALVKHTHQRLLDRLTHIMNSTKGRAVLQEPLVTLRNGRYVVPVKADFRGEFRGIVHDLSSSGATVFMEPLEVVELGNDWRQAQLEETREVERVLRELSDLVGDYAGDITQSVDTLAWFDLTLAKARYAQQLHAWPATVTQLTPGQRPTLALKTARHPLLTGEVVPLSLTLGDDVSTLVVTGPNTGGKTVALKTVGLLVVMALAGIPLPAEAEGTAIPFYREVFADIGDEQSIEQSLSTFSGHMTNIITILKEATADCLVLLDELGAGTDPEEGSALARAILSHLLEHEVSTIATTHHSDLKAFAHNTPGVRNASVEFDLKTLRPTYRLIIGIPGQSNALSIAGRLGLPVEIGRAAQDLLHPEHLQVEALLNELQHEREVARRESARATEARRKAEDAQRRWAAHETEIEKQRTQLLEDARQRLARQEDEVRSQLTRATQAIERALRDQRREELVAAAKALQQVSERVESKRWQAPTRQHRTLGPAEVLRLVPGARVRLRGLDQVVEVVEPPNEQGDVAVLMGQFRSIVKVGQLEPAGPSAPNAPGAMPEARHRGWTLQAGPTEPVESEVHLRGQRVDEALGKLDQYLEDAFRAGLPFVRVIHGKGTGVMRQAVRDVLSQHPLVRGYETAAREQGGEGVTVATLAH
ncbi:MAG: endonuclease MutS2 [Dehalococcoidia bacterium]|nr:endonuclease MutS2 [Dehalococcoidia bacterium]